MLKRTVIALLLSLGTVALAHAGKAAVFGHGKIELAELR